MQDNDHTSQEVGLTPVATFVLWTGCLVVGIRGLIVTQAFRSLPPRQLLTVQAELINPQLTNDRPSSPLARSAVPLAAAPPPPSAERFVDPALPPLHPINAPGMSAVPTIALTYGEGEGEQPAPEYPPEAVVDGEEGSVKILMDVDENGRVTSAQAIEPCRWPLLNESAVRSVRETWRFRPGPKRRYEVTIDFVLTKRQ
jgi:periplasmic protein TonB